MENATDIGDYLLKENQAEILDFIYMEHHSELHPFHHHFIDKSQGHRQRENISQPEPQVSFPSIESVTYPNEQVIYQHNLQSRAEGCHSEMDRNSINKDFKETVGIVRRPLTYFNRSVSVKNASSPFQEPKSQPKNFTCEICKKSLSSKSHLTRHIKIHCRKKPCACEECGAFTRNDNLLSHKRIHTGGKPYSYSRIQNSRYTFVSASADRLLCANK